MDVAIWNVLHDGEVSAAEGSVPGDLRLSVGISYLCGHLPTRAEHVLVTLTGCERFEYHPYEGPPVSDPVAIAAIGLEVLSAEVAEGAIRVECSDRGGGGYLLTRYSSTHAATAEGQPLSQAELEAAAERYWSLWAAEAEARRTPL
ncbi:MAG: hypothetical protein U0796_05380 [Gemmatales bacterium]